MNPSQVFKFYYFLRVCVFFRPFLSTCILHTLFTSFFLKKNFSLLPSTYSNMNPGRASGADHLHYIHSKERSAMPEEEAEERKKVRY